MYNIKNEKKILIVLISIILAISCFYLYQNLSKASYRNQKYIESLEFTIKKQDKDLQLLSNENINFILEVNSLKKEISKLKDENKKNLEARETNREEVTVSRYGKRKIICEATAYGIDYEGSNMQGITATGTKATVGRTIAVDPNVIPLGSKVHVSFPNKPEHDGVYIAEDTGGAIKGNIIDLYVGLEKNGIQFGRQEAIVQIIDY